jgi:hypothetical protein
MATFETKYPLSALVHELKALFTDILRARPSTVGFKIPFIRHVDGRTVTGVTLGFRARWPRATPADFHQALLSLHRQGYVTYGATSVTLKKQLLAADPRAALVG